MGKKSGFSRSVYRRTDPAAHCATSDPFILPERLMPVTSARYFAPQISYGHWNHHRSAAFLGTRGPLHLYAALAEKERRLIAERTKAALAAKKSAGASLGNQ